MKLTNVQADIIKAIVAQGDVSIATLHDDLVDHLCCVAEDQMAKGKSFETALAHALLDLAPAGLQDIQRETVFLLNTKKIYRMRMIMYTLGLLSAMSFVLGWMFGMMHWPGARELSIYGFTVFVFIYLPLFAFYHFRTTIQRAVAEKWKFALGLASGVIIGLSVILKVLHMPGADWMLLSGTLLFVFAFLPYLFFTMYKKTT